MTSAERQIALPGELTSVRQGRLFARDVVRDWGLDSLADDVQLATSELITNAVRHAGTDVVLSLRLDTSLTVEVQDSHPELRRQEVAADDVLATSGRGLHIVAAVSSEWGVRRVRDGKAVWFTLALPDVHATDADVFAMSDHRRDEKPANHAEEGSESQELQARAAR
jgi:anti-sigma regulatory factor (Ser/Thr protein kinase)